MDSYEINSLKQQGDTMIKKIIAALIATAIVSVLTKVIVDRVYDKN